MFLSIIIPTFNRGQLLDSCLNLLHESLNGLQSIKYEVIVTDDSTNNFTEENIRLKYNWVKWIAGPKRGPAANRNNGAKFANGQWLVFLDDDCLPERNWLIAYVNSISRNKNVNVFEGCTRPVRSKERYDEESVENTDGHCLLSCNFAIHKDLFFQLNGFDESFPYAAMEDIDFHTRVSKGNAIIFLQDALVLHPYRKIKLFKTFTKHLKSFRHYKRIHHKADGWGVRWLRLKIFVGGSIVGFKELVGYSMKGWPIYLEKRLLDFCLIFV